MGFHALLQGIFPVQGANLHLLHCGWFLYHLCHQGSPMSREIAPSIGCATGQWFVCHHRRETSGTNATAQPPGEGRRGGMEGDAPLARIFFFCAHGSLSRKMMIIPMLEKKETGKKGTGANTAKRKPRVRICLSPLNSDESPLSNRPGRPGAQTHDTLRTHKNKIRRNNKQW